MNLELARSKMISQQIRACNVLDDQLLDLISKTPREHFVPSRYQGLAFADIHIPIGHQQVMMTPQVEARMLQALNIKPTDKILEVGTGSGFVTALFAKLGQFVYSIEYIEEFVPRAKEKLSALGIDNVSIQIGDGIDAWEKQQPYDVICFTGALSHISKNLGQQLKIGGRLFAIVGQAPNMHATLLTRLAEDQWQTQVLFETLIPPLLLKQNQKQFIF